MRSFSFTAKNIGRERYLTYTMGEGCELDEDILDLCEEDDVKEIVKVVFEEDDDYDYLTYDITGKMSLEKYTAGIMTREKVFKILRNVAISFVSCKENAIPLAYILLNKGFMYINPDTLDIQFICLPVESEAQVSVEFKSFARQLLANIKYDVEEDLSYVGQLLTYINGDAFNLRGLIGLTEALMEDAGIGFEEEEGISTDDGAEVINIAPSDEDEEVEAETSNVNDFMKDLGGADEPLPEINFDEDDEEEFGSTDVLRAASDEEPEEAEEETYEEEEAAEEAYEEEEAAEEAYEEEEAAEEESYEEEEAAEESYEEEESYDEPSDDEDFETLPDRPKKAESFEEIKARLEMLVNGNKPPVSQISHSSTPVDEEELDEMFESRPKIKKNNIKVNRAALIQNAVTEEEEAVAEIAGSSKNSNKETFIENIHEYLNGDASVAARKEAAQAAETDRPVKSNSILSVGTASVNNTMLGSTGTLKICPYIIRVNTEERVMITKTIFKIGKANRGNDYTVDGNGHISRQHAIITQRDGVCYIKDNKSTNHTYVNGKEIADGAEEVLTHGCRLSLGDEEFIFKLR